MPDQVNLEAQIRSHQGEVWHFLRHLGCNRDEASDLTQEAFLVALRKGLSFDDPHGARSYLRQTAKYLFLDLCRKNGRSRWLEESEAWTRAVDDAWEQTPADNGTWLAALATCRNKLEGRRNQAVALFYGQRLPRAEVARRLDMKETGLKTLLQRVRADLRKCIDRELRRNGTHDRH